MGHQELWEGGGGSPENRGECGRIDSYYRNKLALSQEVPPSSECLDGGRQRSRRVVYHQPFRQEQAPTKDVSLNYLRKIPEIYVCGTSGTLRSRNEQRE